MHILLTANSAWNIVNFRSGLVRSLLGAGHQVAVLAPEEGESGRLLEEMGCRFVSLEMERTGISPLNDVVLFLRFVRHFRELAPDVVLGFTIKNNLYGAYACRLLGIRFIPNVTGLGTIFLSGAAMRLLATVLYRTAFRPLPLVFFQNEDDMALFDAAGLVRAGAGVVIPGSGIDLSKFSPAATPPVPKRFLFIGRILRDKGVLELIEAARHLKAFDPEITVALMGQVDAENRTAINRQQVQAWVDEGLVEYLGAVPDPRAEIARSSCVVLPSYREGLPRALLEAAAMARPAIATDVPGCRSVVDHGVTGFLCEVKDGRSLADTMRLMAELKREDVHAMGLAARRKVVREFGEHIVIDRYHHAISPSATTWKTRRAA